MNISTSEPVYCHVPVGEGEATVRVYHRNEYPDPETVFFERQVFGEVAVDVNLSGAKKYIRAVVTHLLGKGRIPSVVVESVGREFSNPAGGHVGTGEPEKQASLDLEA